PIRTTHDRDETAPCIIAGPTCDSVDVLYEKTPYPLPVSLAIGDKVLIEAAGAYTATYSSVGFNGYPPLRQYVIWAASPAPPAEKGLFYFGWTLGSPPGLPGGGMTGVLPVSGVGILMPGSTTTGGQITPPP